MNSTAEGLDRVASDLAEILQRDGVSNLSDGDVISVLCKAGAAFRLLESVIVDAVDAVAAADPKLPDVAGCRSMNELLQRALLTDSHGASRLTKAADAVRRDISLTSGERLPARYPQLREALVDGAVGVAGLLAAITPVDRAGNRIGLADRLAADAELAAYARGGRAAGDDDAPHATPDDIRWFAHEVAAALDPDGAEPIDQEAQHQRYLEIGRLRRGAHPIRGNLLPEVAAQLQLIIDAQNNPKTAGPPHPAVAFRPSDDEADDRDGSMQDEFNEDPRNVIDPRTPGQKRHDALAAALGIAARHHDMPSLGGAAPTLVVQVDAEDFASGVGWATIPGSDAPVPHSVAAHTACTGAVQRVLLDEGRIVGISVTDRVFTVHQRRAIVARDKECLIPGCHVPASWCEIHHVTEHARGGPTHTDNGVPLCWFHHRSLGRSGWEIRMADGVPQIRGPAWWDPSRSWRVPRPSLGSLASARR